MMKTQTHGEALVVTMEVSRLDSAIAVGFKNDVFELIEDGHTQLVFDMGSVDFIDSSGLGAMVSGLKKLGTAGTISLASLNPAAKKMLEMTRLDRVFDVHDNCQQALSTK